MYRELSGVEQRRLANVRAIVASGRYPHMKALADALGITKSSLSQLIGSNPLRAISERTARRWEHVLELPEGSLDQQPKEQASDADLSLRSTNASGAQAEHASVRLLDEVMNELERAQAVAEVSLSAERYRVAIKLLYRLSVCSGGSVNPQDAMAIVRLGHPG